MCKTLSWRDLSPCPCPPHFKRTLYLTITPRVRDGYFSSLFLNVCQIKPHKTSPLGHFNDLFNGLKESVVNLEVLSFHLSHYQPVRFSGHLIIGE